MTALALAAADLARSGISPFEAGDAGMYVEDVARDVHASFKPLPALVIPYYDIHGAPVIGKDGSAFMRVRYLKEPPHSLTATKFRKYMQPPKTGTHAYFPAVPGVDWAAICSDPSQAIMITEGEKKALAATLAGVPCIGIGGVYNWLSDKCLLPELASIEWRERAVTLAFDSDVRTNKAVSYARCALSNELTLRRGAAIKFYTLEDKDGAKQGVDDRIVDLGRAAFADEVNTLLHLSPVEERILARNQDVVWVEEGGFVLDIAAGTHISKSDFVKGSRWSAEQIAGTRGPVPLSEVWLTSPLAFRVDGLQFTPRAAELVAEGGKLMLNTYKPLVHEKGDVSPFLSLTSHVMGLLPDDLKDFAIKLLAYKMQNPHIKTPIAILLVGSMGSGKSLWAEAVRRAFGPYGKTILPSVLMSDFNGYQDQCLLAVLDEVKKAHVRGGADTLKTMISEAHAMINEKFMVPVQRRTYSQYILTTNNRDAASFSRDDRRMFVVGVPDKIEDGEFYHAIGTWLTQADGSAGRAIGYYLQHYPLEGWVPPKTAPMTAEKAMAHQEGLGPVEAIAEEMLFGDQNTVVRWLDHTKDWAEGCLSDRALAAQAHAVLQCLRTIQVRPWYTPEELMHIFAFRIPEGSHVLGRGVPVTAGAISSRLRECGIKFLTPADNAAGFTVQGKTQVYLVVSDCKQWQAPMTQADFDGYMQAFPRYGAR